MAAKKATAKRTKKQHTPDYYPVQRSVNLGVPGATLTGTNVGDAGKLLSIANRRLYRQGKMYQIKLDLDMIHTMDSDVEIEVYALANTWDIQRGYALARETYERATRDERGSLGNNVARWEDFRVGHGIAGAGHLERTGYFAGTLALTTVTAGEHQVSQVDDSGTTKTFDWSAADGGSTLSIIQNWSRSGRAKQDPANVVNDVPYEGVNSDDMSAAEANALQANGNDPPYAVSAPTMIWVKVGSLYYRPEAPISPGMQRLSTGFFDAPCGLFVLKSTGFAPPSGSVRLTAKAGEYKGVAAHAMCQEME